MPQFLEVLDNALLQGLLYGVAVLGITIALRIVRFPDLTADGSFLLGAAIFSSLLADGYNWSMASLLATAAGGIAGIVTAGLHYGLRMNRLLTGILTTMILYSVSFRILGGHSNINISARHTLFSAAEAKDFTLVRQGSFTHPVTVLVALMVAICVAVFAIGFLKCDLGLLLRAVGGNARLTEALGWPAWVLTSMGLAICNGLVSFAGTMVVSRQGFIDINMGTGVVIVLIAALVVGEELGKYLGLDPSRSLSRRTLSAFAGAVLYFFFYLAVLRGSILGILPFAIQPTDLRMLSAAVLIGVIALRSLQGKKDEELFPI
jgi:putative tryptophan/tyrosine transport system permease protein